MTDLIVVPQAAHFRTGVVVAHWCWGPIFQEYFWPACVFAKFDMSVSTNAGSAQFHYRGVPQVYLVARSQLEHQLRL